MPAKIATIGFNLPVLDYEEIPISSQKSLLDYDISVFDPALPSNFIRGDADHTYKGKPCLNDLDSFALQEYLQHWKKEVLGSIGSGKTVFVLLNTLQTVYVATGEKTYSGTGRNRQTTRHVIDISNYGLLPTGIEIVNSVGTSMKLFEKEKILASYWNILESISEYRVFVNGTGIHPLVITKTGSRIVGAYIKYKEMTGTLILLPYINFERDEFIRVKGEEECWNAKGLRFGRDFVSVILGVTQALSEGNEFTPEPEWLAKPQYVLLKEAQIKKCVDELQSTIDSLKKQKEQELHNLSEEKQLKRLLFEKGVALESAILKSLEIIGFKASRFCERDSEFDVIFESSEGRFIGEAEGKDNKSINVDKLRQLSMNLHEDLARDSVSELAKGVLFGNAHRLMSPEKRTEIFTAKCVAAAKQSDTALVNTIDLFVVAKYLSENADKEFAGRCRTAILEGVGVVAFPAIPQ